MADRVIRFGVDSDTGSANARVSGKTVCEAWCARRINREDDLALVGMVFVVTAVGAGLVSFCSVPFWPLCHLTISPMQPIVNKGNRGCGPFKQMLGYRAALNDLLVGLALAM